MQEHKLEKEHLQANTGHWTATIPKDAHNWVWKIISRMEGVADRIRKLLVDDHEGYMN